MVVEAGTGASMASGEAPSQGVGGPNAGSQPGATSRIITPHAGADSRDNDGTSATFSNVAGVQVGSGNTQVNYFFGSRELTSGTYVMPVPASGVDDRPSGGYVFISYVREDSGQVDALQGMLEANGIPVWRDTASLWPGEDWRARIRAAITDDALVFIACFSSHSAARRKSYQNEELMLAIDQLRQRRPDDPWLIPVRFDDCEVPDYDLGAGRTLTSLHRSDLFGAGYGMAAARLVAAIQRLLGQPAQPAPASPGNLGAAEGGLEGSGNENLASASASAPLGSGQAELADALNREEALRLAAAAVLALTTRGTPLQVPIILSIEALKAAPILEADVAVRHAMRTAARLVSCIYYESPVGNVAFSPDGTRIAACSGLSRDAGTLRVSDAATETEVWHLDHHSPLNAMAFSPDGTRIATVGGDWSGGMTLVMDAVTGAEIWRLDHDQSMNAVAFSPDGTRIATGSHGGLLVGSARVIDAATGAEIWQLDHHNPVLAVAFSPDGTRVATACDGGPAGGIGMARVMDAATGAEIWQLDHKSPVRRVAFSPDGTRIATASGDPHTFSSARLMDAVTGAEIWRLDHGKSVKAMAFSPDGTRIATATSGGLSGGTGVARVIDMVTGAEIWRLEHDNSVNAVAFSPDGTRIATASGDMRTMGTARVMDAATGAEILQLDHNQDMNAVAFSPDGTRIATASGDWSGGAGMVCVVDAAPGAEIWRLDHDHEVRAVAFSPDGTRIATAGGGWSGGGMTRVLDAATGAEIWRLPGDGDPVLSVVFSLDGAHIATAGGGWSGGGMARVLDAATGTEVSRVGHDQELLAVEFSPDVTLIFAASRAVARLIDVATGAEIWRLDHDQEVSRAAFSPDGTRIVTASGDSHFRVKGSVRVMDARVGAETWRLNHEGAVLSVAFSQDGTRIATASSDPFSGCIARVINAATGAEISRVDHNREVLAMAFSPDGTRIATAGSDGTTRVWCTDRSQLIEQAKSRLTRNLTQQEWNRYFHGKPYRKTRPDLP